jgi:hypothetical protein
MWLSLALLEAVAAQQPLPPSPPPTPPSLQFSALLPAVRIYYRFALHAIAHLDIH